MPVSFLFFATEKSAVLSLIENNLTGSRRNYFCTPFNVQDSRQEGTSYHNIDILTIHLQQTYAWFSEDLAIPSVSTERELCSFQIKCASLWNNIPSAILFEF